MDEPDDRGSRRERSTAHVWASALCLAGGLLIVTGGFVLLPLHDGAELPLGLPTEMMNEQLSSSGKPAVLLAAWAIVPGSIAAYAGFRQPEADGEGLWLGAVAIAAGLVGLGPGGGFLWGTILTVLGGSLAIASARAARLVS